jgi:hypothetical protein
MAQRQVRTIDGPQLGPDLRRGKVNWGATFSRYEKAPAFARAAQTLSVLLKEAAGTLPRVPGDLRHGQRPEAPAGETMRTALLRTGERWLEEDTSRSPYGRRASIRAFSSAARLPNELNRPHC